MATNYKKVQEEYKIAQNQWGRYMNALQRGHLQFQSRAKINENFYLGAGRQWDDEAKKLLEAMGKPWLETNLIFSAVNTVLGYQTQSRMDIAYKPRETNDQDVSDILTKVGMYEADRNKYQWIESQVFADGCIQSRGYFDIRMDFDDNMLGNIKISSLDPLDVIPDPNAKSYNPEDWADVIVAKWVTLDDIEEVYGKKVSNEVELLYGVDRDFGDDGYEVQRNKFGNMFIYAAYYTDDTETRHVRLLERQWKKLQLREFWYDVNSGDFYPVPDDMKPREKMKIAKENGYELIKKVVQRIRWTVSTRDKVLFDEWSPYEFFTIVPFFPYFRRGETLGMVDNLVKTQEMVNKVFSQILHVVNTTANSGWIVEQNSLVNMDVEDLEERGAETGLVIEHKTGRSPPKKIDPNQIPTGLENMMKNGIELIRLISGVSETFQGGKGNEVSGLAIQSKIHQTAVQLATPIDNLYRTRMMVADILLKLIQTYYTEERTFLVVSGSDDDEKQRITINQKMSDGSLMNDITVGKYDVVVSDIPTQITFQNAQFQQALEMRKYGIMIPDTEMIKMSSLTRKNEIAEQMSGAEAAQKQQEQQEMQLRAQIGLQEADKKKKEAEALSKNVETALTLQQSPQIAVLIDLLTSLQTKLDKAEDMEEKSEEQGNFSQPQQSQPLGQEEPLETSMDVFK